MKPGERTFLRTQLVNAGVRRVRRWPSFVIIDAVGDVIYREFQGLGWLAFSLGVVGVVLLVVSALVDQSIGGWSAVVAILVVFPVLFLGSVYRMNRIRLSPTHLVVGSERFQRSDFDFSFGVQPPLVLAPGDQAEIESRWKLAADRGFRIAGGSWGRRVGTAMVVLQERDERGVVAIFTRRPQVLDPLLTEWLETVRGPEGERDTG